MCSELTPRARIPDTRIPQLMQPCIYNGSFLSFQQLNQTSGCNNTTKCFGYFKNLWYQFKTYWLPVSWLQLNVQNYQWPFFPPLTSCWRHKRSRRDSLRTRKYCTHHAGMSLYQIWSSAFLSVLTSNSPMSSSLSLSLCQSEPSDQKRAAQETKPKMNRKSWHESLLTKIQRHHVNFNFRTSITNNQIQEYCQQHLQFFWSFF